MTYLALDDTVELLRNPSSSSSGHTAKSILTNVGDRGIYGPGAKLKALLCARPMEDHVKTRSAAELTRIELDLESHIYEPLDVVLSYGKGVHVWDIDGNRYLDCLSAYSAVNQGHCHPKILAAMIEQAKRLTLTSRAFRNDQLALFYEEIVGLTGSRKVLPMNSGAEAVETAVKAVRKWGHEVKGVPEDAAEIIVCGNNFHGRTLGIVSFSTDTHARRGFGPFVPGFKHVPFGDFGALAAAITPNTVAFLLEPIQAEAGVVIPPPGYFAQVRELCTRERVTLILDEIQSGLGRTGKLLAQQHEGIEADVTLVGKALSGGFYPVSAVLSNSEVLGVLKPGHHGSTYGGNPLACAVARTALRVLFEESMIENATVQGERLKRGLQGIRSNAVREVRGRGLMLAVELSSEAGSARRYCEALRMRGVLTKEVHQHIRVAPPLVITGDQVDWVVEQFDAVLTRLG